MPGAVALSCLCTAAVHAQAGPAKVVQEVLHVDILPYGSDQATWRTEECAGACTTVAGLVCMPSMKSTITIKFDGDKMQALLTQEEIESLSGRRLIVNITDANDPTIGTHQDLHVTTSYHFNFGDIHASHRLYNLQTSVTVGRASGQPSVKFVASTQFCTGPRSALHIPIGTARCPEDGSALQASIHTPPPEDDSPQPHMPPELCAQYTLNGQIPVAKWYYDDKTSPDKSYQRRSHAEIERLVERARNRENYYYDDTDAWMYVRHHGPFYYDAPTLCCTYPLVNSTTAPTQTYA